MLAGRREGARTLPSSSNRRNAARARRKGSELSVRKAKHRSTPQGTVEPVRSQQARCSSRRTLQDLLAAVALAHLGRHHAAARGGGAVSAARCTGPNRLWLGVALRASRTPRSQWCRCRPCRCRRSSSSPPPSSARSPARCGRAARGAQVSQGCAARARAHAPTRTARAVRCAAPTERKPTVRREAPAGGAAPQGSAAGSAEEAGGSTAVRGRLRVCHRPVRRVQAQLKLLRRPSRPPGRHVRLEAHRMATFSSLASMVPEPSVSNRSNASLRAARGNRRQQRTGTQMRPPGGLARRSGRAEQPAI